MKRPKEVQALVAPWVQYADSLEKKLESYERTCNALASWDDKQACQHLHYTRKYEAFPEPRSARLAREALKENK